VRYYYQENAGKHIALNTGVRLASAELCAVIDSDDWYRDNALERLVAGWDSLPDPERYVEVQALRVFSDGTLIGTPFPNGATFDSDAFEIVHTYGVTGDKVGMQRTAVLREFPFPEEFRRVLVSEALIWNRVARQYRTRYLNEVLGEVEYQVGGLSDMSRRLQPSWCAPRCVYFRELATTDRHLPFARRMRAYANWIRNALLSGRPLREEMRAVPTQTLLFVAAWPVGALLAIRDRTKFKA
jgi:glycosyltransferase involved in cell wall biosynthesis